MQPVRTATTDHRNLDSLHHGPMAERAPTPHEIQHQIADLTARLEIVRRAAMSGMCDSYQLEFDGMDRRVFRTSLRVETPRGKMDSRIAVQPVPCGLCGSTIRPGSMFTVNRTTLCWRCNPGAPVAAAVSSCPR